MATVRYPNAVIACRTGEIEPAYDCAVRDDRASRSVVASNSSRARFCAPYTRRVWSWA